MLIINVNVNITVYKNIDKTRDFKILFALL